MPSCLSVILPSSLFSTGKNKMVKYVQNIDELRRAGKQPQTCAECEHRIILTQTGDSVCERSGKMIHPLRLEREICSLGKEVQDVF